MCLYKDYGLLGRVSEQNKALEDESKIERKSWTNQSGSNQVVNVKLISQWLDRLKALELKAAEVDALAHDEHPESKAAEVDALAHDEQPESKAAEYDTLRQQDEPESKAGEIKELSEEEQQELKQYKSVKEQCWFDSQINQPESWVELEARISSCEKLHEVLVTEWGRLTRCYRVKWERRGHSRASNEEASGETEEEAFQKQWFKITKLAVSTKVIASSDAWLARKNEGTGSFWGFVKIAAKRILAGLFNEAFGRETQARTEPLPDENTLPPTEASDEAISALYECIEKLPPEEQVVIKELLRGWNLTEIAQKHGILRIYDVFKRAKQKLRRCLES